MRCVFCGGLVLWMGPFSNLTHTQCQNCGAANSQASDDQIEDDGDNEEDDQE